MIKGNLLKHLLIAIIIFLTTCSLWAQEPGTYLIINRHSGKALTIINGCNYNANPIVQEKIKFRITASWLEILNAQIAGTTDSLPRDYYAEEQHWNITRRANGYYSIISAETGRSLDITRSSMEDEAGLIQYTHFGTLNQQWLIRPASGEYYRISARHSSKCLDVPHSSLEDGVQIIQYRWAGTTNQEWRLLRIDDINDPPVRNLVVISIRGSSYENIHPVVLQCVGDEGITLTTGVNWIRESSNRRSESEDTTRIMNRINHLVNQNGGNKSNLSLLIVGKSAGGILAWYTLRAYFHTQLRSFTRVAVVLVDAHGAVDDDGRIRTYDKDNALSWPIEILSPDATKLRVYNIYQHRDWPTGASLPSCWVYENNKLTFDSVNHEDIPTYAQTREMIQRAIHFAAIGE